MLFKNIAARITSRITFTRGLVKGVETKVDTRFQELQSRDLYNIGLWIHIRDARIIERLQALQDRIRVIIGGDHFYTPEDEFHSTVSIFIDKDNPYSEEELGTRKKGDLNLYEEATKEAVISPVVLGLKGIMITDTSVCIIGDDEHALDDTRLKVRKAVDQRKLDYLGNPNIVHSTLIRFLKPVTLEQRRRIWAAFKDFEIGELTVDSLVLAHITTFGRFNSRTESRYIVLG